MDYNLTGTPGVDGLSPAPFIGPGGPGTSGGSLTKVNTTNNTATTITTVTGGAAGSGGFGSGTGEPGGAGGALGGNGTAVTKPTPPAASSSTAVVSKATGSGGAGGVGGGPGPGGLFGAGGTGGNGYAASYAYNGPLGSARAYAYAYGGAGGSGDVGGNGGTGQISTVVPMGTTPALPSVVASGINANAGATQTGGGGGVSFDAGQGGQGANSYLINAVGGASEAGDLTLKQLSRGGAGGASEGGGGVAGTAGNATSELTFDDTKNVTPAAHLYGYSTARGGAGGAGGSNDGGAAGSYATATNGGTAYAKLVLTGDAAIGHVSTGGIGPFEYRGSPFAAYAAGGDATGDNTAVGGTAKAYEKASSTTTTSDDVTAGVRTAGGSGAGSGAGGAAIGAKAIALDPDATGGSSGIGGVAYARAAQYGGSGGGRPAQSSVPVTLGVDPNGGNGGAVSRTSAYASGYIAWAVAVQDGGDGGIGYYTATSGKGADSTLTNAVSGRTSGGADSEVFLAQKAQAGSGGETGGGTAGAGGYGTSELTFNDYKANPKRAATVDAYSEAYGGHGGQANGGTGGANGGGAYSSLHLYGTHAVTGHAYATGGYGGESGTNAHPSSGGSGANATVGRAYVYSSGGTASANALAVGGHGGKGIGAANDAGAAGAGIIGKYMVDAIALGHGNSASARANADGGYGGYGYKTDGAAGATETLTNAVYGISNYGTLSLSQTAVGGAGGGSFADTAGLGGNATSTLALNDTGERQNDQIIESAVLIGVVHATAGAGGGGYGGSDGANGGGAVASLTLTGGYQVAKLADLLPIGAYAQGGAGGGARGPADAGTGGSARATDDSTTLTAKSNNVYAYTRASGGNGGGVGTGSGNGGAGGAATLSDATATGNTQTGGFAFAHAVSIGGKGGSANGAGKTGGLGGTVSGTTATATGYSAKSYAYQTGGSGGNGYSGADGGNGANSFLKNAVTATTTAGDSGVMLPPGTTDSGSITLKQTAGGGAGGTGNGTGAVGGTAGYGYSYLDFDDVTANTFHAGTLTATVSAYGGNGGTGPAGNQIGGAGTANLVLEGDGQVTATTRSGGGFGEDQGGLASADSTATSDGSDATDTATATATSISDSVGFGGADGIAGADATAKTASGQQATATASITGGLGSTDATSASTTYAGPQVLGVDASTSSTAFTAPFEVSMTSGVNVGAAPEQFVGGNPEPANEVGGTVFAWATGLPTGSIVSPLLTNPYPATLSYANIAAALGSAHDSDATVLGYGIEGVGITASNAAGGPVLTSTQTYYLGATALSGELVLGLADDVFNGSGFSYDTSGSFTQAALTVTVGGVVELDPVFNSEMQFDGYFNDSLLDIYDYNGSPIPAGGLPVTITLAVTTTAGVAANAGFQFVLGSTGVVSPLLIDLTSNAASVTTSVADAIPGVSLSEAGDTTGDTVTVTLKDTSGALSVALGATSSVAASGATLTGDDSKNLVITGSLTQVNNTLATLTDTDAVTANDIIEITATDTNGDVAVQQNIAVAVTAPIVLTPVITTPVYRVSLEVDTPQTLTGYPASFEPPVIPISIRENNSSPGEFFTVTVSDPNGKVAEGSPPPALAAEVTYGPLSVSELEITGDLANVNEALTYVTAQNIADGSITVTAKDQYGNLATPQSFTFDVGDTPAEVAALTLSYLDQLAADGVTSLTVFGAAAVTVDQAQWFHDAGISLNATSGAMISDTGSDIATELSTTLIGELSSLNIYHIEANDGNMTLSIAQAEAIEAVTTGTPPGPVYPDLDVSASSGVVTVDGTVNQIENLSTAELAGLAPIGVTGITATGPAHANVALSVAQAEALANSSDGGFYHVPVTAPTGGIVELYDKPAAIQALLQPSTFLTELEPYYTGITEVACSTGALPLTLAEAQVIANLGWTIAPGTTVTIDDTAADIENYLATTDPFGIADLVRQMGNVTSLNATDASITLTVAEAEALEQANTYLSTGDAVTLNAPLGSSVTLSDSAADIEAMTPAQLAGLTALGVTGVIVYGSGVTLSVAQALAIYDPLPFSVPPGTQFIVADMPAEIESLTPAEIAGLSDLGVTQIGISGLTGGDDLTIEGGVTLAIDGPVPMGDSITFAGTGGTLSLDNTPGFGGTIFGFTPVDAIDLTDATYDSGAIATLDPTTNILTVSEVSGTYTLQLDPSLVFVTIPDFYAEPDAGTGTEVTYIEGSVNFYAEVYSGLSDDGSLNVSVDGVVIARGGEVEVVAGNTANRTIIQDGGYLLIDSGATETDTFIHAGGTLELQDSSNTVGDITFGPATGIATGGTLLVDAYGSYDFPTAAIAGFASGDTIDLTQTAYDPQGTATIESGNTLQIVEYGNTYDLTLDPLQDFLNQSFTLAPAGNVGTDVTEVQAPTTTGAAIPGLEYVVGAVVTNGGSVDIRAAGTLNAGTVVSGGTIQVEDFGTLANGLINTGGLVDVLGGGSLGDPIYFGSDGGALELQGTILPGATIYGFGGNDTIDLPGVAYVAGTTPTLTTPGDQLQFTEDGTAYSLNFDPAQEVFPGAGFVLSQDAGSGTEITLLQNPIDGSTYPYGVYLSPGQDAAGLVVEDGGYINDYGSIVNVTINSGGAVYAIDNYPTGGAVSYATINDGGTLAVANYTTVTGAIDFGSVGGTLEIQSNTPPAVQIDGMAPGDIIDLTTYFPYVDPGPATVQPGNLLQFTENGSTYDLQLDPSQDFTGDLFSLSEDPNGDTFLTEEVACFLRGTHIRTTRGEVEVQDLAVGDTVVTLGGRLRRLCWIGKGNALAARGKRSAATPVIVSKDALADNVPNRDLRITKGHALFLDDVLIPVEFLVNHRSIRWDDVTQGVEVYHLELDEHDILIADGAAAESYRDDGNRWLFGNANQGWDLPAKPACAPVLTGGPVVDAVWRRLLDRAGGPTRLPLTQDAQMVLAVDGILAAPATQSVGVAIFHLAARPAGDVRIVSRSAVPAELGLARDSRELGVALRRLVVRQGSRFDIVEADDPRLTDGFHAFEPSAAVRWTTGDATLPAALFRRVTGAFELVVRLGGSTQYIDEGEALRAA